MPLIRFFDSLKKIFQDPNRKRRIKKILTVTIIVFVIALAAALAVWLVFRQRKKLSEELGRRYANTIEYIQDDNFLCAGEECKEAIGLAEKLRDKKRVQDISDYQKLIEALDCLEALYTSRGQAEEEDVQEAKENALAETGAAQLTSEGDKAFAQGDYEGAKTYYTMALEKYQEIGDDVHAGMIQSKMDSSGQKSAENKAKEQQAEDYVLAGKQQEAAVDKLEAKKQ